MTIITPSAVFVWQQHNGIIPKFQCTLFVSIFYVQVYMNITIGIYVKCYMCVHHDSVYNMISMFGNYHNAISWTIMALMMYYNPV